MWRWRRRKGGGTHRFTYGDIGAQCHTNLDRDSLSDFHRNLGSDSYIYFDGNGDENTRGNRHGLTDTYAYSSSDPHRDQHAVDGACRDSLGRGRCQRHLQYLD